MLLQHIIKIILVRKNIYISIGNWSKQFKAYQKLGVFHSWGEVDGGVRVRERSWNLAGKAGREFHLHLLERSNCGPGENSIIHLLGNKVKWTGLAAQRLPESEYSNAFKGHANSKKKKKNWTWNRAEKKGFREGSFSERLRGKVWARLKAFTFPFL